MKNILFKMVSPLKRKNLDPTFYYTTQCELLQNISSTQLSAKGQSTGTGSTEEEGKLPSKVEWMMAVTRGSWWALQPGPHAGDGEQAVHQWGVVHLENGASMENGSPGEQCI